jgi:hypothetical protein
MLTDNLFRRISDIRVKREKAAAFARELRTYEERALDPRERDSLAARRRDVEISAAEFEHLLAQLEEEAHA